MTQEHGFPILMRTYPGTTSKMMIFKDLCNRLLERGFRAVIIDRGMGCENNIRRIHEAPMGIICGLRKTERLLRRFLRPIRIWQKEHVEGHVRACYLAYAVLTLLEYPLRDSEYSAN